MGWDGKRCAANDERRGPGVIGTGSGEERKKRREKKTKRQNFYFYITLGIPSQADRHCSGVILHPIHHQLDEIDTLTHFLFWSSSLIIRVDLLSFTHLAISHYLGLSFKMITLKEPLATLRKPRPRPEPLPSQLRHRFPRPLAGLPEVLSGQPQLRSPLTGMPR